MTDNSDNVAKLPQRVPVSAGAFPRAIVPSNMDEAWRVAKLVVASGLAPRDVQTPERAMVAVMTGLELGLPPMTAIQRIAVINGRPCIWGDAVPAIAQRTGMLEKWDEDITGEGDAMVAHCTVTRRINAEATITKTATFSVADAKKAKLWSIEPRVTRKRRDGGTYETDNDSPWYRFPKRMLAMRARVAFRDLFADAMCGLYIAEEMVSGNSDAEMRDVTPTAPTVIHNPLQDDAETTAFVDGNDGVVEIEGDAGTEMEVMPPEQPKDRINPETSPPGATGGSQNTPLDHDPVTGEVFDSPATLTNPANEITDPSPEKLASARLPRQARGKPADGPKAEPVPKQPEAAKTSPGPNPALGVALEQPWIKRTPADYVTYLWQWTEAWTKWGQDPIGLRDRFSAERTIRNGLGLRMDDKQLAECKAIAAGAFAKLGGQLK